MDLNRVAVFVRVVETESFTAAAAALGLPKSSVSRAVSRLEDDLGVRLLQRTTRKLSLTDAGRTYYEHCARIVSEIEDDFDALLGRAFLKAYQAQLQALESDRGRGADKG
jgi:DNA-binding transcriptional LysR family regulator